MSWRPNGWNDIRWEISLGEPQVNAIFEAGADAILTALRARGHHVDGPASFTSVGGHCTLSNEGNTGNYVFIPDDEVTQ